MGKRRKNPFKPGAGRPPPLRVGHKEAARVLEDRLDDICESDVGDVVVLLGPRGNGKTALLNELRKKAEKRDAAVRALVSGMMRGGEAESARHIRHGWEEPTRKIRKAEARALNVGGGAEFEESSPPTILESLHFLLKKKPVLLAVDEAHVMPVEFGRDLLQAAQDLIGMEKPLLLVLAGTPGVRSNLESMGASFWERCMQLRIGRLESEEDIRRAIAVPADRSGLPADEDALDLLAQESQGYPYFIQMLAAAAWDAAAARRGAKRLELQDAQAGVADAERHRRRFCLRRYAEAEKQGVLAAATAVSREMVARGTSPKLERHELTEILEAVASGADEIPLSVREKLGLIGFIWETDDGGWEPGIPSLCAFFVEEERKAAGKGS